MCIYIIERDGEREGDLLDDTQFAVSKFPTQRYCYSEIKEMHGVRNIEMHVAAQ